MTAEVEQLLGQIEGKVDGINRRLDSLNGSVAKLFAQSEENKVKLAESRAICSERHRDDALREQKIDREDSLREKRIDRENSFREQRTVNFTFKEFIIILVLVCTISVGGALTVNALGL